MSRSLFRLVAFGCTMKYPMVSLFGLSISFFVALGSAQAQPSPQELPHEANVPQLPPLPPVSGDKEDKPFTIGGYVEAFYQYNVNRPSNGITNYRGFDNRHNSFTLSNVALDTQWDQKNIVGRLTLQIGHTPSTYYLAEPAQRGGGGANDSNADLWKYIQQAYAGYQTSWDHPLTITAGVFLSPIGPEGMAVHDNWNWSRSNLFFGLPFYHTGAKAKLGISERWAITAAVYNGWNSVVDNNQEKSIAVNAIYTHPKIALSFLYFGGVERPKHAPEGRAWRHVLDAHATWTTTSRLSLIAHANAGVETNNFGTSDWLAGALYARVKLLKPLFVAARGDLFYEQKASNSTGEATSIFWPVSTVGSGTFTVDFLPHERVSFRLEYRHDQASGDMFYGKRVQGDGELKPFIANRDSQDTITLGATSWF